VALQRLLELSDRRFLGQGDGKFSDKTIRSLLHQALKSRRDSESRNSLAVILYQQQFRPDAKVSEAPVHNAACPWHAALGDDYRMEAQRSHASWCYSRDRHLLATRRAKLPDSEVVVVATIRAVSPESARSP
jgi:hypothetical protein